MPTHLPSPPTPQMMVQTSLESKKKRDPYVTGQGGKDHKYVQHLIRAAAHERGYKADIELDIAGGSVDVAVEGRGQRIACEISITTDADHEAGNVAKCLAGGFDQVWLVVLSSRRKSTLAKAIHARFESAAVSILTVEEAILTLDGFTQEHEHAAKTVRGYSVKVRHGDIDADEARRRREAVASILARSLKAIKD